jgi:hypothetical protein
MTDHQLEETQENLQQERTRIGSLLTVDIGSINTRVALYDTVEGRYRFLVAGVAQTTTKFPLFDASEGVRLALDKLELISGRTLTDDDAKIIVPSTKEGSGTDYVATTISAGEPLKTVVVGLLEKVSLTSATNLANTIYTDIIESISLNDRRKPEDQIDTIQQIRPDVILISGGTDNGASKSVLKLVNSVGLAIYLLPESHRPEVLFAGNPKLAEQVMAFIEPLAPIHIAPNIRPSLAKEQLGPAQMIITDIYRRFNTGRVIGIAELNTLSGGHLLPSSHGLGRVIRFFSKIVPHPDSKGVLGINVGASSTIVAGGFNGDLRLRVFTKMGMGEGLISILENSRMEDIVRWLPIEASPIYVLDYIQNKITHPATLPATQKDLYIEQALAREVMRKSVGDAISNFPKDVHRIEQNTLPVFDPIVVGGAVLANAPTLSQSLLMILDAIEPTGIQRIILDKNNLVPGLGAAAAITPALVAQLLLDPTAFLNLGFIISPISRAREGTSVLRVRIQYEAGHENVINVHQGNIETIPLPMGQRARIFLDPLHRANIGFGPGKSSSLLVIGGPFGVVVDARGRPINLHRSEEKRRQQLLKWQMSFA